MFICVCAFSLHRESSDLILGDKPLSFEVVLSHVAMWKLQLNWQPCRRPHSISSTHCGVKSMTRRSSVASGRRFRRATVVISGAWWTGSSPCRVVSTCHPHRRRWRSCSITCKTRATKAWNALYIGSAPTSTCRACYRSCRTTFGCALCASGIRANTSTLSGFFNLSMCHPPSGPTSRWISWRGSRALMANL
jgi:hypothetical protein